LSGLEIVQNKTVLINALEKLTKSINMQMSAPLDTILHAMEILYK
jgi:hypothetical protein